MLACPIRKNCWKNNQPAEEQEDRDDNVSDGRIEKREKFSLEYRQDVFELVHGSTSD